MTSDVVNKEYCMRKVVIVGLGKSGMETAKVLAAKGDTVFVTEIKQNSTTRASLETLLKEGVLRQDNIELGSHSKGFIGGADLMVVSPGVPRDSLAVKLAREVSIPIISELELAYSICPAPIIAVTGTSGKTTVTTLIGEMLKKSGRDVIVCGNIGNPLSGEIKRINKDSIVVLEVSSFQLEGIKDFKPKTSVILNISENHLDRHKDMKEYISLKARIFLNQDEHGTVFLNSQDKVLKDISRDIKLAKVEFFDKYKDFRKRFNIENENYLAAMSVASLEGASESVMLGITSGFKGLEHRLEYVTVVNGIGFYNDSKATTVSSVEWALKSLDPRIILIMGGKYKGGDFGKLRQLIDMKVDSVIAIGEARSRIKNDLAGFKDFLEARSLQDAVHVAFEKAGKGSKILLSPGCSSFDMFEDYQERGRIFKEICSRLSLEHV